jgi:hypothetical protein
VKQLRIIQLSVRPTLSPSAGWCFILLFGLFFSGSAGAQDNYEIQVYGSPTVPRGSTMVEFHTNFTVEGRKQVSDGLLPTNHAVHETLEITHGVTEWFEVGYYNFTSLRSGNGWDWVGTHVRPRIAAPDSWHLPVGLGLSTEFGYQRPAYSPDTWTLEIRPIVDKKLGRWYLALNPTLERALVGQNTSKGFEFSPDVKASFDFTPKISGGLEYYGAVGPISGFDPLSQQEHQLFPVIDLDLSPKWELNFGVGVGMTGSTDHLIVKSIIGYRFDRFPLVHRHRSCN